MKNGLPFSAAACGAIILAGFFLLHSGAQQSGAPGVWQSADIGRVGLAGVAQERDGSFEVKGAGADIWYGADAFQFVYLAVEGDTEISACVLGVEKTHPWAKAGLMIRADLTETAPHAMAAMTPEQGATFIRRTQAGGRSYDDALQAMRMVSVGGKATFQQRGSGGADQATDSIVAAASPRWLKVVRQGNVFRAFDSRDGQTWEWLGTESITMPGKVYAGLAVSSHDVAKVCAANFGQVRVGPAAPVVMAPAKPGTGDGLEGTYFSRMNLTGPAAKQIDPTVNFDWTRQMPAVGVGATRFSVQWKGQLEAQFTEPYTLQVVSDDRVRLWLDGVPVIDEWYGHAEQTSTALLNLEAGRRYQLRLDYFQNRGAAVAKLFWSSPSTPRQIVPQSQLYSAWSQPEDYETVAPPAANPKLPPPWLNQDVGHVGRAGSAESSGGSWTVQGSGADVWANADGFHLVYQPWRGDGQIVARVIAQANTDPWAKAGIVMRESLRADARHVTLAVTPQQGLVWLHRDEAMGSTASEPAGTGAAPAWLKLVRRGNNFSSFTSPDGANWQWVASETLELPAAIVVGLAVNSHDNSTLATVTFDQVTLAPPPSAPIAGRLVGTGDGLQAVYFDLASGQILSRLDPSVDFDWGDADTPAPGIGHNQFSVRWEGFLEAQSSDLYALTVLSDDGARLWLDGQLLIDAWEAQGLTQHTAKINLQPGSRHALKLEYFQGAGEAIAKLLWSTPTLGRQPIPQSQLYSSATTAAAQLVQGATGAGPAIEQTGTPNATVAGAAAGAESASTPAKQLASATIKGVTTVAEVPGTRTAGRLGRWAEEDGGLYAVDRRGALDYELNAPAADVYQLEIDGATRNPFDADPGFYLKVSLDGEYLGRSLLVAELNQVGHSRYFTPWIKPGAHRVHIEWDNARKYRCLKLVAVRLQSIQADDTDKDGVKDWVRQRLEAGNGIETAGSTLARSLIGSATSPACLEGRGGFLSLMQLKAAGQEVPVAHGAGGRWYANVPLSAGQPTAVEASFENGGLHETRTILWKPTDVFASAELTVRQGDSLLFKAGTPGQGQTRIEVAGTQQYAGPTQLVPIRFDQAGTFAVTGSYTDASGATHQASVSVKVVAGALSGSPAAWTGRDRAWDSPQTPVQAVVDADTRAQVVQQTPVSQVGRRFSVKVDAGEDRWVLARLADNGPVLGSTPIRGLDIYGVSEAGAFYGQKYPDGSRLVETAVVQSRVLPDVRLVLQIVVAGVMFEDGTLVKVLQAADFDETGLAVVNFILPPGVLTSNCHIMRGYQAGAYLGEY